MAEPSSVQMHPLAELEEALALNAFYRNRVLLLSNDRHALRETIDQQRGHIDHLQKLAAEQEAE